MHFHSFMDVIMLVFFKLFAINEWSKAVVKYFATKSCNLHCTLYVCKDGVTICVIQD